MNISEEIKKIFNNELNEILDHLITFSKLMDYEIEYDFDILSKNFYFRINKNNFKYIEFIVPYVDENEEFDVYVSDHNYETLIGRRLGNPDFGDLLPKCLEFLA